MFFIFGTPRSGTSLLASTLNLNDQIIIPDEDATDFIVPVAYIFDRVKNPSYGKKLIAGLISSTDGFDFSIGKYLSKNEISRAIRNSDYLLPSMISSIYQKIAEKHGKRISGNKSCNNLMDVKILYEEGLFDNEIKIIHIVRDIRDVVLSLKKVEWGPFEVENIHTRNWNNLNIRLYELFNHKKQYLLIKYEDMVTEPAAVFKRICGFLDVPFQDKMLDHTKRGLELRTQKHHRYLARPFLSDKAGAWEKTMPPKLVKECEKNAYNALTLFGYKITSKSRLLSKGPTIKQADMKIKIRNRDEKIIALNNKIGALSSWGRRLDKEILSKDRRIIDLQSEVEQLGNWGNNLNKDIKKKEGMITKLQKEFDERSEWANSLNKELARVKEYAGKLQKEFDERSEWANSLNKELIKANEYITKLQKEFEEKARWADNLNKELMDQRDKQRK